MITYQFWLIFSLILIIIELNSLTFYLLSIAAGSIFAAILDYSGYDLTTQIIFFSIISIICILLTRPLSKHIKKSDSDKYNTERFLGKKALTLEDIKPHHVGKIRVDNEVWLAISEEEIVANSKVYVVGIDSTKLIVSSTIN